MRSNELRDDGASLTTFEDLAPIFYFYGSVFDMGWTALRDSGLGLWLLCSLSEMCLLATGQLSGAPRLEIRLGFLRRSELRLSRLQCTVKPACIARATAQSCLTAVKPLEDVLVTLRTLARNQKTEGAISACSPLAA